MLRERWNCRKGRSGFIAGAAGAMATLAWPCSDFRGKHAHGKRGTWHPRRYTELETAPNKTGANSWADADLVGFPNYQGDARAWENDRAFAPATTHHRFPRWAELASTPIWSYNSAAHAAERVGEACCAPLRGTGQKVDCERGKPTTSQGVRRVCVCAVGCNRIKSDVYLSKESIRCS
jgi:hypothetical protein